MPWLIFQNKNLKVILLSTLFVALILLWPNKLLARDEGFPKLANYFTGWDLTEAQISQLAKWDLVILSPQALERQPQIITELRQANPNIKILVYVLIQEINIKPEIVNASPYYQTIYNTVSQNNWWLKTVSGQNVNWWPNTWLINATSSAPKSADQNWGDYLPQLIYDQFLKNDSWDGVFYDNTWYNISWLNQPLDVNQDGITDSTTFMDDKWREGISQILTKTRNLAPHKLILVNNNTNYYNDKLNGRMQENFPNEIEGSWANSINNYLNANLGNAPQYFVINATTKNAGAQTDYQTMRFGLASALLGNGYYSFDFGDQGHENIWWYDEYDIYLGNPLSGPKNLLEQNNTNINPGVWQRDFQNGLSLVNSSVSEQKISFAQEFEKIKGTQDKTTNNGAIIKSLTLKPSDGIVLLRRVEDLINTSYFNGSFVRVFNKNGETTRNGFFIYDKQFKGNNVLTKQDINKDGQIEILVADSNKITIYNSNKKELSKIYPYGAKYNKGINFVIADFENDGYFEIITGTMRGYAPLVKIFNHLGEAQGNGFYAYAKNYLGGVNVAVGDTTGNGDKEIITGAGYMGGPLVRIFDKNGKLLSGGFFAYAKTFKGGVNVACGDIDGNGIDEIVTGAGYGGSSHVRIFNSKFQPINPGFFAFGTDSKTRVRVTLNDLDNDGTKEILAASPDTFTTAFKP